MATKSVKSAAVHAREAKKRRSLSGWRLHGTVKAAAKACGAGESTVRDWYRTDHSYRHEVDDAIEHYAVTAGQETHNALVQHVRDAVAGKLVLMARGTSEQGKPFERYERVMLQPALCRLILTRADSRFTHPKQQHQHSGALALQEAVAAAAARLENRDDEHVSPPTH